jgi:thiosulfate/3-mercaptopyruvate sulfurtransferase
LYIDFIIDIVQVLDARPFARFAGQVDEPRPGMKRGHIPGAVNIPLDSISFSSAQNGAAVHPLIKSDDDLRSLFISRGVELEDTSKPIVCSCGSGVTACQLIWALHVLGRDDNVYLYGGSWSEWGSLELDLPNEMS